MKTRKKWRPGGRQRQSAAYHRKAVHERKRVVRLRVWKKGEKNIGILQRGGYCRTKKVVGNQTADQSGFVIGVLHDTPPLDVGVKQTGV